MCVKKNENPTYFDKCGKKVTYGDIISWSEEQQGNNYYYKGTYAVTLDADSVQTLLEQGRITAAEPLSYDVLLAKASKTVNIKKLITDYPSIALQLLLRIAAIMIDDRYPDHIKEANTLWVVTTIDGSIIPFVSDQKIPYKTISLFRTKEDAKEACKALKPLFKALFNE